tara:strand:- start:655 stop:891 length:237 start_codon:yes stop_codon:yes gene_type:complete
MKTQIKIEEKLNTLRVISKTFPLAEKFESSKITLEIKSYQKLFLLLMTLSSLLIIPESPKELENICKNYHSNQICNVW